MCNNSCLLAGSLVLKHLIFIYLHRTIQPYLKMLTTNVPLLTLIFKFKRLTVLLITGVDVSLKFRRSPAVWRETFAGTT